MNCLSAAAVLVLTACGAQAQVPAPDIAFETHLVRWWGTEGSQQGRPIYRIARTDNGLLILHYSIVPGRVLTEYTMPYWPIRSCFALVSGPAEVAHHVFMHYTVDGQQKRLEFNPRSGIERAEHDGFFFLKIRNRSIASPEDATIPAGDEYSETTPCMAEHVFALRPGSPVVHVACTLTNVSDRPLAAVSTEVRYAQSFNWSDFGSAAAGSYAPVEAPAKGRSKRFFAYSAGMAQGYEFSAGPGSRLEYQLEETMNRWTVTLGTDSPADLAPGASTSLAYTVRVVNALPEAAREDGVLNVEALGELTFERIQPDSYKAAPVEPQRRVTIGDQLARLAEPKVRGLNLRASFPGMLKDLDTIREWSGNLVILGLGNPEQTAQAIEHGHAAGLEMLLQGRGRFDDGPPSFDAYYETERPRAQQADAHGQDEDHYYWFAIPPSRDFETDFGKPLAQATQEERVEYWGRCFHDKWQAVHEDVKQHAPNGGIWFYSPMPGIAHTEPLDYYDPFLKAFAPLGGSLTVFPFYYGIEYNQAEYMVRKWKDACPARVVFLPMCGFLTRPSQFFRVISAGRRGGADGACGFHFPVGESTPDDVWQWQSVLLAARADFPTPELDVLCLMEEPAGLVEALARSHVAVMGDAPTVQGMVSRLNEALPGEVVAAEEPIEGQLVIKLERAIPEDSVLFQRIPKNTEGLEAKGFLVLETDRLRVCGATDEAMDHALELLMRFVELAAVEAANS